MSRSAHFVRVLQAIIDDPHANGNERRAAETALGRHRELLEQLNVSVDGEDPPPPTRPRPVVITIEGGTWTITSNGRSLGSWPGELTLLREQPVFDSYDGHFIRRSDADVWQARGAVYADRDAELDRVLDRGLDLLLVAYPEGARFVLVAEARIGDIRHTTDPNHYNTRFTFIDMVAVMRRSMLQVTLALGDGR